MLQVVAECHLKVRNELRHGRYDWFRPIYGTNVQNEIIRANKELQVYIDSGSVLRNSTNRFKREGKIFTFQANEPLTTWLSRSEKIFESINHKGLPFIEYSQGNSDDINGTSPVWIRNSQNRYRTYSIEDYNQYVNAPNLKIVSSYHFLLFGLDRSSFTIKELYQEIYNKINTVVGPLKLQNIMIFDTESLMTDIFSTNVFHTVQNLQDNLERMGRVACVKMDSILDAACLIAKVIKITLPMNNGKMDEPVIVPSEYFKSVIHDYTLSTQEIKSAGAHFRNENNHIETLTYNIDTIVNPQKVVTSKKKNKRKKPLKDQLIKKNKNEQNS